MLRSALEEKRTRPWHRLRLSPALEARFRAEPPQNPATVVRSWLLVFVVFNVLSLKLDFDAFGPDAFVIPATLTLGVFVPIAIAAILSLRGEPSALRIATAITATSLVDMGIVLNSARIAPAAHADVYLVLAVIVPLSVGLIAPLSFRHSLVFCGLAFTLYLGWVMALPRDSLAGGGLFGYGLPLLVASLVLVPLKISFSREQQEKQAFLLRLALEEQAAELEAANARLKRLSETDVLTGLTNRRAFDATLAADWDAAEGWYAVIAVDIDHFKRINDTAGHPEGDRCLVAIAAVLDGRVREAGGLLARYGGEEFMALLPGRSPDEALGLGEGLRAAVEGLALRYGPEQAGWIVTASVGVTVAHGAAGRCGVGASDLVAAADRALYCAKNLGRNRVAAATVLPQPANGAGGSVALYSAASS